MSKKLNLFVPNQDEYIYLMKFIDFEINLGIHNLNTCNNKLETKKLLDTHKISPEVHEQLNKERYLSTTWTVNRGCWFFDFIKLFMHDFVEIRDKPLSEIG